jgi:hypothetical protein
MMVRPSSRTSNNRLPADRTPLRKPDIELERHTAATLLRLRRNALERLCETRDLDIAGTKPQLAQALINWVRSPLGRLPSRLSTDRLYVSIV